MGIKKGKDFELHSFIIVQYCNWVPLYVHHTEWV